MMLVATLLLLSAFALALGVTLRHYTLVLTRLYGRHRQPYLDIGTAPWPRVAVFLPCRDEKEIGPLMLALLAADYPAGQLVLIPIDDPDTPATAGVLDDYAARFPGKVVPFHRARNDGGRAGALREASQHAPGSDAPVHLVFDGAYRPGRGLIKQLVAPLFDPEIGAVFGRILTGNGSRRFLPRLLELARAAGAQIDQQARVDRNRVPELAAPVAAVRRVALVAIGGWRADAELESLELGYRLAQHGWGIAYQNRAECYETVPEEWSVELREVRRCARGRAQALARHWSSAGADGLVRLARPFTAVFLLFAWALALILAYTGAPIMVIGLALTTLALFARGGSLLTFFAIAAAARLDGSRLRVRLLPLAGFAALTVTAHSAWATVLQLLSWRRAARPGTRPARGTLARPAEKEA